MEKQLNLPMNSPAGSQTGELTAGELLIREGLTVRYITQPAPAQAALERLLESTEPLGLDTETAPLPDFRRHPKAGLDPHLSRIRLLQVFGGDSSVYVFDLYALPLDLFTPLWQHSLVAHNALFDLKHLLHAGADPTAMGCTLLMTNALTGLRQGLAHLARQWLDWQISKEQQTSDWDAAHLSGQQLEYAALDAVAVRRLFEVLKPRLEQLHLARTYALMRDAQRAIGDMELNGIYFDVAAHARLMQQWQSIRDEAYQHLLEQMGPEVSPSSGKQLSLWLRSHLDAQIVARWPRTATGQLKTDAGTLKQHGDHPLLSRLLHYREFATLLSTFGSGFAAHVSPVTGRIHADFHLGGTATGRLSCSAPNIQNPPRDAAFRALFAAPPGRRIVVADYSQIELRVAALVSGDRNMRQAYAQGQDLHRKTAAVVTGVPLNRVTAAQRQGAKAVNFGLLYGQGAKGLARYARSTYGVNMSEQEAQQARNAFFNAYPGLRWWQQETIRESSRTGTVATPGGRRIKLSSASGGTTPEYSYTGALNSPIQGGAAEVMLAALGRLPGHLRGLDARLVNVVHDELVLEVAAADGRSACEAVTRAMIEGMLAIFPEASTVKLVEAQMGPNWAEAK